MENNSSRARVWCDGCYDMVHFGHSNQLRQAKAMGAKLVVGVHTDREIAFHKGPPVFSEKERYRMVRAIKWVDEVVEGAPYETTVETLNQHDCDFCVHGNDVTLTAGGEDTYADVKRARRYRECERTPAVSTTDLVGRMLLLSRAHHSFSDEFSDQQSEQAQSLSTDNAAHLPWTRVSRFTPAPKQRTQIAEGRPRRPTDRVVYVCGSFDLFHVGHLCFLEAAAKLGDYLIVGLFSDQLVNRYKNNNYPVMTLHERVLSVLAYRPVSEVIVGAPYELTEDMVNEFHIDLVANGVSSGHAVPGIDHTKERFTVAQGLGIYRQIASGSCMTTNKIVDRILENRRLYEIRNRRKERNEVRAHEEMLKRKPKKGENQQEERTTDV